MIPLPDFARSELFPFEGDMRVKELDPPVLPEPPRGGEGGNNCRTCTLTDDDFVWANDRWWVGVIRDLGCPIALSLLPKEHYDSPDLPEDMAAELGVLLIKIERAILATGDIGRVHFNKWCDGGAHLHWWILGREEGALQQRGSFLVLWAQTLPPPPAEAIDRRVAQIVSALNET
jgi:diadenosine tetraphosphate (Ap4A) HIT family hydrolase